MQMRTTPHGLLTCNQYRLTCNQYRENSGSVHSVATSHMMDQKMAATIRSVTFFAACTLLFDTNTHENSN